MSTVPLGDVVSDAVACAAPVAAARGVRLVAAEDGWPTVQGSEPELSRVVANLLVNAIRHTPPTAPSRSPAAATPTGGWFAVADGCGGIPEADLPRVFDVAFRATPSRTPVDHNGGAPLPAGAAPAAASGWRSCAAWSRPTAAGCGVSNADSRLPLRGPPPLSPDTQPRPGHRRGRGTRLSFSSQRGTSGSSSGGITYCVTGPFRT